jgi:5-methylcytosine-specific restriction endonuclease McrA
MQRDGWRCTVPGCTSYRNLHAHHVVFRSAGGSDDAENLTTLCAAHHQRGVHGGGPLRITGRAPAALRFDLPLESFASGDVKLVRATG